MKRWTSYGLALALLVGLGQTLRAQPAAPAVPATPTNNLWSFLCLSAEQREACKTKFCSSPLGKLFSSMAKPVGLMTGGLLGGCCPTSPTREELEKLKENPESTEGAAAAIKKAEAEAKARRAAVRYLGTVDCNWWPEAEDALIKALRGDTNECVRLEAAWALNRGCCCTKKTIEHLKHSASGSKKDGYPAENSIRVKGAAAAALANCLANYFEETEPKKKEGPDAKQTARLPENATPAEFDKWLETVPMSQVVADARRTMAQLGTMAQPGHAVRRTPSGLVEIVADAFAPTPVETRPRQQPVASLPPPKTSPYTTQAPVTVSTQKSDIRPVTHLQSESTKPVLAPPAPKAMTTETSVPKIPAPPVPVPAPKAPAPLPPPVPVQKTQAPAPLPSPTKANIPSAPVAKAPAPATVQPKQVPAAPPSAPAPVYQEGSAQQLIHNMAYGQTVAERQQAAERLSASTLATHPEVIQALVLAARQDAAPAMRVTCIRCLARVNANHTTVMSVLMSLKSDVDAHVRQEATLALDYLSTLPTQGGVHQTSWRSMGSR